MKKTQRIIIDAEPLDVIAAIVRANNLPGGYDVKEFVYSLSKITDKDMLNTMGRKEYRIVHCRLVLEKEVLK